MNSVLNSECISISNPKSEILKVLFVYIIYYINPYWLLSISTLLNFCERDYFMYNL